MQEAPACNISRVGRALPYGVSLSAFGRKVTKQEGNQGTDDSHDDFSRYLREISYCSLPECFVETRVLINVKVKIPFEVISS
jgi:hypothetical protein